MIPTPLRRWARNRLIRTREGFRSRFILPDDTLRFLWWESANWGDALNHYLVERLSGRRVQGIDFDAQYPQWRRSRDATSCYLVVGSTLEYAERRTIVWGAGFRRPRDTVREPPRSVLAVRGPASHALLRQSGIACDPVYGDPALLMPRVYRPQPATQYEWGVIPHYRDKQSPHLAPFLGSRNILVIDVESGIETFVDQVCRCARIASSSLHGMILADAYRIPAVHVSFNHRTHGKTIKFQDHAEAVGRPAAEPVPLYEASTTPSLAAIEAACVAFESRFDPSRLLASCPFLNPAGLLPE
jgi:pyruvyltransferase